MPRPMPSTARRQYLIQKGLKSGLHTPQIDELFEVLEKLFELALTPTYLLHDDADNPPEHHTTVLGFMLEIATGETYDWPTVREAAAIAILHDIWPVPKITSDMIRNAPDHEKPKLQDQRNKSVPIHMQKGSEHARNILNQLNEMRQTTEYDTAAIDRICGVIAIHDNPKIDVPIPTENTLAMGFREADRLWMQDPRGVRADLTRKGNNYPTRQERVRQSQDNVESFRAERARVYPEFPRSHFIDEETLFRTRTGHRIFQRLRTYWECQAVELDADE